MPEILEKGLKFISRQAGGGRGEAIRAVSVELLHLRKELEQIKDPAVRRNAEMAAALLVKTFLTENLSKSGEEGAEKEPAFPTKEEHYRRNENMPMDKLPQTPEEAEKWAWDDSVASDCHQFTSPDKCNVKYVSPDGKSEVIFDSEGDPVTSPEDCGTYNFANPNKDPIGHFNKDVLPWIVWGNSEDDSTDMRQRLRAFVVVGGANAVRKKVNIEGMEGKEHAASPEE